MTNRIICTLIILFISGIFNTAPASINGEEIEFTLDLRIRTMDINTSGYSAFGPYGTKLTAGTSYGIRSLLEISYDLNDELSAGAILRVSNETEDGYRQGPYRWLNKLGSGYIAYTAEKFNWHLGAYSLELTPLTLSRWDFADNPQLGSGSLGCGCSGSVAIQGIESIEDVEPAFQVEGGKTELSFGKGFKWTTFYARPQSYEPTLWLGQHLYGTQLAWYKYHSPSQSRHHLRLNFVKLDEEKSLEEEYSLSRYYGLVSSLDWRFVMWRGLELHGEIAKGYTVEESPFQNDTLDANAGWFGIKYSQGNGLMAAIDGIFVDEEYLSLYGAPSYLPNTRGARFAFEIPTFKERLTWFGFGKMLKEIEPPQDVDPLEQNIYGFGTEFDVTNAIIFRMGGYWQQEQREDPMGIYRVDNVTDNYFVSLDYDFHRNGKMQLKFLKTIHANRAVRSKDYDTQLWTFVVDQGF